MLLSFSDTADMFVICRFVGFAMSIEFKPINIQARKQHDNNGQNQ
jgi:hypothetical protein